MNFLFSYRGVDAVRRGPAAEGRHSLRGECSGCVLQNQVFMDTNLRVVFNDEM